MHLSHCNSLCELFHIPICAFSRGYLLFYVLINRFLSMLPKISSPLKAAIRIASESSFFSLTTAKICATRNSIEHPQTQKTIFPTGNSGVVTSREFNFLQLRKQFETRRLKSETLFIEHNPNKSRLNLLAQYNVLIAKNNDSLEAELRAKSQIKPSETPDASQSLLHKKKHFVSAPSLSPSTPDTTQKILFPPQQSTLSSTSEVEIHSTRGVNKIQITSNAKCKASLLTPLRSLAEIEKHKQEARECHKLRFSLNQCLIEEENLADQRIDIIRGREKNRQKLTTIKNNISPNLFSPISDLKYTKMLREFSLNGSLAADMFNEEMNNIAQQREKEKSATKQKQTKTQH